MAGVRQFDEAEILDKAMTVFWEKGYTATSIQDLVTATGLGRGSLYGAFGDKKGLYRRVLDKYAADVGEESMAPLSSITDPRTRVRGVLEIIAGRMSSDACPAGCLNTLAAIEGPHVPGDSGRNAATRLAAMEDGFYQALRQAQAAGTLPVDRDARAMARFFVAVTQGLAVMSTAFADETILRDIVNEAMNVWEIPPTTAA